MTMIKEFKLHFCGDRFLQAVQMSTSNKLATLSGNKLTRFLCKLNRVVFRA